MKDGSIYIDDAGYTEVYLFLKKEQRPIVFVFDLDIKYERIHQLAKSSDWEDFFIHRFRDKIIL